MSLSKSDLTKINSLFAKMDSSDFTTVAAMFKNHRNNAASMATGNFKKGDSVFFVSSRSNQKISGVVEKVMLKNIKVSTSEGMWRVPATMLQAS
jgi:acid phosphatase class B